MPVFALRDTGVFVWRGPQWRPAPPAHNDDLRLRPGDGRAPPPRRPVHDRRRRLLVDGGPARAAAVDHQRLGDRVLAVAVHDGLRRRRAHRDARPRDAGRRARGGPARRARGPLPRRHVLLLHRLADAHDRREHVRADERVAVPRRARRLVRAPRARAAAHVARDGDRLRGHPRDVRRRRRRRAARRQPAGARRLRVLRRAAHGAAQVPRDGRHAADGDDRRPVDAAAGVAAGRAVRGDAARPRRAGVHGVRAARASAACSRRPRRAACRRRSWACSRCSSRSSGRCGCGC